VYYFAVGGNVAAPTTPLSDDYLCKLKKLEIDPDVPPCSYAKSVANILSDWLVAQQNQLNHQHNYLSNQLERTRELAINQSYIDKGLTLAQSDVLTEKVANIWKHKMLAFLVALSTEAGKVWGATALEETGGIFDRYVAGVPPAQPPVTGLIPLPALPVEVPQELPITPAPIPRVPVPTVPADIVTPVPPVDLTTLPPPMEPPAEGHRRVLGDIMFRLSKENLPKKRP